MPAMTNAESVVAHLADWSPWVPFTPEAVHSVPRTTGVYMHRERGTHQVVYAGMTGDRSGNGMRGRLSIYALGRAPHSGFGSLCLDRALADLAWMKARLTRLEAGEQWTTVDWAGAAVIRADLEVRWASTSSPKEAGDLEDAVLAAWTHEPLWNRKR
jgi:hypothetical protein